MARSSGNRAMRDSSVYSSAASGPALTTAWAMAQHKILDLLDYPVTIYTELAVNSANPP
jgi:hypothetical protein